MTDKQTQAAYDLAKQQYADLGVDTDVALKTLATVPISLHCWQGDDVGGFETGGTELGGGLAATGNYPGKARTPDELRADADEGAVARFPARTASTCTPSTATSAASASTATRSAPEHFAEWIDWAKAARIGLDFNPTYFSHPPPPTTSRCRIADTASASSGSRTGFACRADRRGDRQGAGDTCITNFWIPDGMKDTPVDRVGPRERLLDVARRDLRREPIDPAYNLDAVEGKLFGIGCESYTVGSHEFYFGYALTRGKLL